MTAPTFTPGQPVEVVNRWTGAVLWRGVVESVRADNGQASVTRDGGHRRHHFSRLGAVLMGGPVAWVLRGVA